MKRHGCLAGAAWLAWLVLPGLASAQAPAPAACPPAVEAPADAGPTRDRGMLWRLQRDGRTSYLYGTLHIGRPAWQQPGPRVAAALAASDTLAVEIDLDDPRVRLQLVQAQQSAAARAPAPPPDLRQRLARAAARGCVPLAALADQPPLMQAGALTLLDARWLGLDAAYGQERALGAWARANNRPVVSLETAAEQATALQPAGEQDAQRKLAQALDQLEDGSARQVLFRLAEGWERGDLALLADYDSWCGCLGGASNSGAQADDDRRFLRVLNDERNPRLAARIEAQHARGRRVFAAVGALHMTGPAALPGLLRARGFRVQRVPFSGSGVQAPPSIPSRQAARPGRTMSLQTHGGAQ